MTIRQFFCGLRGHDRTLHFKNRPGRWPCTVVLRCDSCEHETPGLAPLPPAYRQTYSGDPRRHRLSMRKLLTLTKRKDAA